MASILALCGVLFVMLLFRLPNWTSRIAFVGSILSGGIVIGFVAFVVLLMGIGAGGVVLDMLPWLLLVVLIFLHVSPPKAPSTHEYSCEQCGAEVHADADLCPKCPAKFIGDSGWRVIRRR